jgi:hypothetical protein
MFVCLHQNAAQTHNVKTANLVCPSRIWQSSDIWEWQYVWHKNYRIRAFWGSYGGEYGHVGLLGCSSCVDLWVYSDVSEEHTASIFRTDSFSWFDPSRSGRCVVAKRSYSLFSERRDSVVWSPSYSRDSGPKTRPVFIWIIFKNLVRTSKETQRVSITK